MTRPEPTDEDLIRPRYWTHGVFTVEQPDRSNQKLGHGTAACARRGCKRRECLDELNAQRRRYKKTDKRPPKDPRNVIAEMRAKIAALENEPPSARRNQQLGALRSHIAIAERKLAA